MGELRDVPVSFGSPLHSHSELQEKGNEEIAEHDEQRKDASSSFSTQTHMNVDQELVITTIRAMNVAIGLTRLPAGFYTAVRHSGLEWRTANNPVSVKNDVVEWDDQIPIPSDRSAMIHLEVYASFEFQPMLGQGKSLRELSVTIQQLLDLSDKGLPFSNPTSSCLALLVTVGPNSSTSRALGPHRSIAGKLDPLEEATDQGHGAFSRYQKNGRMPDLERSIEVFQRALDNCSSKHPCRAGAQSNLAMAKSASCQVNHTHSFDDPIALYRDALSARPAGHPDRPLTLINLAVVHLFRFERQQDAVDVTQAEALLREAMDLSGADSHEEQAVILARRRLAERTIGGSSSTGNVPASRSTDDSIPSANVQLLRRFERSGDLAVLDEAISTLAASISESVHDPISLGNLGVALWYRFARLGQLNDLERAIEIQRDAVDSVPDNHPSKSGHLNNLGNSLLARFHYLGKPADLNEAISSHREAIGLIADGHFNKPRHLSNLGNCFLARFERLGKLNDLEEAITMHKDAVGCIPDSHSDKSNHLNNLATCFRTRFRHVHELCDLDKAISHHQKAVGLTLDKDPSKSVYLNNFATSVLLRFMQAGESSDLIQAIAMHQQALQLTPDNHSDKPRRLNNLANSFLAHFECLGNLNDLKEAILGHGQAIELTPDGHPDKPRRVNNLANSLRTRFQCIGELNNLEQAILEHRKAMELPDQNGNNHIYLNSLATSFIIRFKHLGNPSDLEEATSGYNKAAELTLNGYRRRPGYLNDFGMALLARFEWSGKVDDLEQGISKLKKAVQLTANTLPEKTNYLHNLGICLRTRFTHIGQSEDLDQAIAVHNEAIRRVPGRSRDNLNRWNYHANVSTTDTHFEYPRSEQGDLEQAILSYEEAVKLTSDHHPDKRRRMNNLANCLLARFEQLGDLGDLEKATTWRKKASELWRTPSATHLDRKA